MLQRPSYEMSVTAMAPSQFEFETPALDTSAYPFDTSTYSIDTSTYSIDSTHVLDTSTHVLDTSTYSKSYY